MVKCPLSVGAAQADFALAEALAASRLSSPQGEVQNQKSRADLREGLPMGLAGSVEHESAHPTSSSSELSLM